MKKVEITIQQRFFKELVDLMISKHILNYSVFDISIEHPVNKELSIVLEYFSGTHDFAGIIPGLVYHNLKRDVVAVVAYRIPANSISGDSGFVFELGKYFDFN